MRVYCQRFLQVIYFEGHSIGFSKNFECDRMNGTELVLELNI